MEKTSGKFIKYTTEDQEGKRLLANHSLDEEGVWEVRSTDDGGRLSNNLGLFQGKLRDVITYSVELPGFWGYGGGSIRKLKITNIDSDSTARYLELRARQAALKAELAEIESQLK